ncbi:dihydropyrimidinase [Endozoicomonas gorgoniicola]|uniref:Dihydropyrimidinase n=1 Tax=Endozoicomonas gorgoniicola TaxID=1234144 RepID=A0ABT3MP67_9GAMM|nr:dihydropyrimidinase [Endozoicomonas gorgoniicola]MCW7551165.1 dihydropyrimidinase [Endozoicomonas gorgoniicola]
MSVLIKNATLVNADASEQADIFIQNGIIERIAPVISRAEAEQSATTPLEVIDASGKYLIPGGVDVHTHFNIDVGIAQSCDDFYSGTVSAACGGTTTIIDHMGFGPKGCSLHHQLARYHEFARDSAVIDYSFHGTIQHIDDSILDEMESMVLDEGISSFKLYLTYGFKLDDTEVLAALSRLNQLNALTCVHPENDGAIRFLKNRMLESGLKDPIYHALSRPPECEAEAVGRMINLAVLAGDAPVYIVHLSNGIGLEYIRQAHQRGQPVFAETCPQYLQLDINRYNETCSGDFPVDQGLKYIISPPLRDSDHLEQLWNGLQDGTISTIATDHCAFTMDQKRAGRDGFQYCPNGMPGVENRIPLMFSEGVMKGRLSINHFVDLVSTRPAQLFGLYPRKGVIAEGSDADLVIIDPDCEVTLSQSRMHSRSDYCPYEGMILQGYPVMTLSRGKVIVRNGVFKGLAGDGEFIPRETLNRCFRYWNRN